MMRSSLILMAFLVLLVGCDVKTEKTPVAEPAATTTTQSQTSGVKKSMTNVKMETSAGTIMIELDAEKAPLTVANIEAYIKLKDNDFLNHTSESGSGWGYAVFGKVTEGLDVMDTIAAVKTGQNGMHGDVPLEPVMINSVTIVE